MHCACEHISGHKICLLVRTGCYVCLDTDNLYILHWVPNCSMCCYTKKGNTFGSMVLAEIRSLSYCACEWCNEYSVLILLFDNELRKGY